MFNRKISKQQLCAWIFTAMSAPLAQFAGRSPWGSVLAVGILAGLLCVGVDLLWSDRIKWSRWLCIAEWTWLIIIIGSGAVWAVDSWPVGNAFPTVPIVLLALAAAASDAGAEKASRIGGVLFWLLALIYAIILCAGGGDFHLRRISSEFSMPIPELVVVFLLPALAIFLPREKNRMPVSFFGILAVFALILSLLTAGGISSLVAEQVDNPFYQWVRGLSLFKSAQRFESIISVALTMGWFSLFTVLLSVAGHLTETFYPGCGKKGTWLCAILSASIMFVIKWIPAFVIGFGSVVLWVVVPVLLLSVDKIKKMKKSKKSA